ncbi:MAG: hypothetical protein HY828_20550 [Actinobacteria bacterium]|nr:hypothetical protein [Actinomycetota bacterium]
MTARQATWARAAMLAAAIVPIVVAIVRAIVRHWFPIGDNALLYIRVVDVGTEHHPLLGSWTSASLSVGENMNNPGPIYQDLAAPFAKLFGPGPGAALGVGTINILAVVGISLAARRIGGWLAEQWALLAAVALAWTMGSELLIDIWQAHALLLPFLLLLVLLAGLADGQTWCLGWSLAVASLLVQTHISYAYVLAILWPAAFVSYLLVRRGRPHLPWQQALRSRRALYIAGAMLLLWSQTLIEQFFGPGKGNLSRLAGNAGGGDLQVGLRQALGMSARVYTLPPWWLRSGFSSSVPSTPLSGTPEQPRIEIANLPNTLLAVVSLLALLALLGFGVVRHRRGERHVLASASLVALVGVVGSILAVSKLTVGPVGLAAHHVRLLWPLAVFVHTTALAVVVAEVRSRLPEQLPRSVHFVLPAIAVVAGVLAVPFLAQPQGPVAEYATMPTMRRIMPHIAQLKAVEPVLFDISTLRPFEPYSSTMLMTMQDMDIEFRVDDEGMVRQLGESRRADGSEPARVFQLQGPQAILYDGDACLVALASQLSPADEATALEYGEQLIDRLVQGSFGVADSAFVDGAEQQLADLNAAVAGDREAARKLVYEGTLSWWYYHGQLDAADDPAPLFPLVDTYLNTAYALFSDQSAPCPG